MKEKNLSVNIGKGCPLMISGKSYVFETGSWRCWMPFCAVEEIKTFEIRNTMPNTKNVKEEIEEKEG